VVWFWMPWWGGDGGSGLGWGMYCSGLLRKGWPRERVVAVVWSEGGEQTRGKRRGKSQVTVSVMKVSRLR
jgi:hypothetical protein